VGVIDAGEDHDPTHPAPFIVFEFVEGETLKDRIRRNGRLAIPEAVAYAIEIAREITPADGLILVTGSLYLVGEAKRILSSQI